MNVIYRVHGAGGFYMETQSQDQAFRAARQEEARRIPWIDVRQVSLVFNVKA